MASNIEITANHAIEKTEVVWVFWTVPIVNL